MAKTPRRVRIDPQSEIAFRIKEAEATGARLVVDTGEASYALEIRASVEPKSQRFKTQLMALAGVWSDLDSERMIEQIYGARHSAPPSPPTIG